MAGNIALIGNPNSGKTTLFNNLTGSTARVGNWPGVTVERKEGTYKKGGQNTTIVDLPGIYSLSPYTPEEIVARNYLIDANPDAVINIVDATNLERNLYLTSQVMETECPMVVALNMMDVVEKQKDSIDVKALEKRLGLPVVSISAVKNSGIDELMKTVEEIAGKKRQATSILTESEIGFIIRDTTEALEAQPVTNKLYHAIKLIENDQDVINKLSGLQQGFVSKLHKEVAATSEIGDSEAIVADLRYKYITKNFSPLIKKSDEVGAYSSSDKIDRVITSRILGIPFFLLMMFLVFHFTFSENFLFIEDLPSPGALLQGYAEDFVDVAAEAIAGGLENIGASDWAVGLVVDGIFVGLGAVLSFLPQILVLFLFLTIMEDSGYMARAAFVMDRALRGLGLSGKSFVPMIMGFGCSVPAIMATRTIEKERDRILTMMLIPFMSCGAKLPIYSVIAAAFFPHNTDIVIFGIYIAGILLAILCGVLLKNILFKGEVAPFIMELPPYRLPGLKALLLRLWEKLKGFIIRAGTILLASVIVIWFLANFNFSLQMLDEPNSAESMLGIIAGGLTFIFRPLGFAQGPNGWMAVSAILTGFLAKEAVVTTMGQLYTPGFEDALEDETAENALQSALLTSMAPAAALSFMVFNLLTIPCMAAVSAMAKEMGSRKYFWITIAFQLIVSWIVACIVYNVGMLFL